MERFDPHLQGVRWAVSSLRPLALRACAEMECGLMGLSRVVSAASRTETIGLVVQGRQRTAHVSSFFDLALGALDPYTDISFPTARQELFTRYHVHGHVLLALEGGCTKAGWHARLDAERLEGVRALYTAIGVALLDDLDQLSELAPALDEQLPERGCARTHLHGFRLGLKHLLGLLELLADAQRVVSYTTPDGRQFMDLFQSAEPRCR